MVLNKSVSSRHYFTLIIALSLILAGVLFLTIRGHPDGSTVTGFATSQVGNFSAGVATYLSCTWSDSALGVSFGSNLNPGTNDINSTGNYNASYSGNWTMYNVTVDSLSNVAANITIRGESLVSGSNIIGVTNITWASNTTAGNGSNLAPTGSIVLNQTYNEVNKISSGETVGSSVWYRFWVDIPSGAVAGSYSGNYTMQCSQAT